MTKQFRQTEPSKRGFAGGCAAALWMLSGVKIGMALLAFIGLYVAMGTVPLGRAFAWLGGESSAPGTTVRHLPWIDLRESEYYATPVLTGLLLGFVLNMVLATIFRIRWSWRKGGVILTHAGVVVIALGAWQSARTPFSGTIVLFADEPESVILDRLGASLESVDGRVLELKRSDLPRYADFGVPWSQRERTISLSDGSQITGFAHSARIVSRLSPGGDDDMPGWQFEERLASGEQRSFAITLARGPNSVARLTDGTVLLSWPDRLPLRALADQFDRLRSSPARGVIVIAIDSIQAALYLPAEHGAIARIDTAEGEWTATFVEHIPGGHETSSVVFRLEGPDFDSSLLVASSWDPNSTGQYVDSQSDGSIEFHPLPERLWVCYADPHISASLVGPRATGTARSGRVELFAPASLGSEFAISPSVRLVTTVVLPQARIMEEIERLPLLEEALLLADPRLGSMIRIARPDTPDSASGAWVPFDGEEFGSSTSGYRYEASRRHLTDARITLTGFEAELFRRGSVPRDFRLRIDVLRDEHTERHVLSLNNPVRLRLAIDGVPRMVQLSLIGWDSRGWESASGGGDATFQGVRYAILSVNHREGVNLALLGGVIVFIGAAWGGTLRLRRPASRSGEHP